MARKRDRIFAGFGALLFLVTSSAVTIAVIVSLVQQHKSNSNSNSCQAPTVSTPQSTGGKTMLQGTKLANFTPVAKVDNLQKIDTQPGMGAEVQQNATVTVDYTGAIACDGIIFQSSKDSGQPVSFPLSGVIPGWTQGIPGMKVGGTRRLLIPASLAYGANPPQGSGIPANADLVFDVTVHSAQ